jgi:hypothetical protein
MTAVRGVMSKRDIPLEDRGDVSFAITKAFGDRGLITQKEIQDANPWHTEQYEPKPKTNPPSAEADPTTPQAGTGSQIPNPQGKKSTKTSATESNVKFFTLKGISNGVGNPVVVQDEHGNYIISSPGAGKFVIFEQGKPPSSKAKGGTPIVDHPTTETKVETNVPVDKKEANLKKGKRKTDSEKLKGGVKSPIQPDDHVIVGDQVELNDKPLVVDESLFSRMEGASDELIKMGVEYGGMSRVGEIAGDMIFMHDATTNSDLVIPLRDFNPEFVRTYIEENRARFEAGGRAVAAGMVTKGEKATAVRIAREMISGAPFTVEQKLTQELAGYKVLSEEEMTKLETRRKELQTKLGYIQEEKEIAGGVPGGEAVLGLARARELGTEKLRAQADEAVAAADRVLRDRNTVRARMESMRASVGGKTAEQIALTASPALAKLQRQEQKLTQDLARFTKFKEQAEQQLYWLEQSKTAEKGYTEAKKKGVKGISIDAKDAALNADLAQKGLENVQAQIAEMRKVAGVSTQEQLDKLERDPSFRNLLRKEEELTTLFEDFSAKKQHLEDVVWQMEQKREYQGSPEWLNISAEEQLAMKNELQGYKKTLFEMERIKYIGRKLGGIYEREITGAGMTDEEIRSYEERYHFLEGKLPKITEAPKSLFNEEQVTAKKKRIQDIQKLIAKENILNSAERREREKPIGLLEEQLARRRKAGEPDVDLLTLRAQIAQEREDLAQTITNKTAKKFAKEQATLEQDLREHQDREVQIAKWKVPKETMKPEEKESLQLEMEDIQARLGMNRPTPEPNIQTPGTEGDLNSITPLQFDMLDPLQQKIHVVADWFRRWHRYDKIGDNEAKDALVQDIIATFNDPHERVTPDDLPHWFTNKLREHAVITTATQQLGLQAGESEGLYHILDIYGQKGMEGDLKLEQYTKEAVNAVENYIHGLGGWDKVRPEVQQEVSRLYRELIGVGLGYTQERAGESKSLEQTIKTMEGGERTITTEVQTTPGERRRVKLPARDVTIAELGTALRLTNKIIQTLATQDYAKVIQSIMDDPALTRTEKFITSKTGKVTATITGVQGARAYINKSVDKIFEFWTRYKKKAWDERFQLMRDVKDIDPRLIDYFQNYVDTYERTRLKGDPLNFMQKAIKVAKDKDLLETLLANNHLKLNDFGAAGGLAAATVYDKIVDWMATRPMTRGQVSRLHEEIKDYGLSPADVDRLAQVFGRHIGLSNVASVSDIPSKYGYAFRTYVTEAGLQNSMPGAMGTGAQLITALGFEPQKQSLALRLIAKKDRLAEMWVDAAGFIPHLHRDYDAVFPTEIVQKLSSLFDKNDNVRRAAQMQAIDAWTASVAMVQRAGEVQAQQLMTDFAFLRAPGETVTTQEMRARITKAITLAALYNIREDVMLGTKSPFKDYFSLDMITKEIDAMKAVVDPSILSAVGSLFATNYQMGLDGARRGLIMPSETTMAIVRPRKAYFSEEFNSDLVAAIQNQRKKVGKPGVMPARGGSQLFQVDVDKAIATIYNHRVNTIRKFGVQDMLHTTEKMGLTREVVDRCAESLGINTERFIHDYMPGWRYLTIPKNVELAGTEEILNQLVETTDWAAQGQARKELERYFASTNVLVPERVYDNCRWALDREGVKLWGLNRFTARWKGWAINASFISYNINNLVGDLNNALRDNMMNLPNLKKGTQEAYKYITLSPSMDPCIKSALEKGVGQGQVGVEVFNRAGQQIAKHIASGRERNMLTSAAVIRENSIRFSEYYNYFNRAGGYDAYRVMNEYRQTWEQAIDQYGMKDPQTVRAEQEYNEHLASYDAICNHAAYKSRNIGVDYVVLPEAIKMLRSLPIPFITWRQGNFKLWAHWLNPLNKPLRETAKNIVKLPLVTLGGMSQTAVKLAPVALAAGIATLAGKNKNEAEHVGSMIGDIVGYLAPVSKWNETGWRKPIWDSLDPRLKESGLCVILGGTPSKPLVFSAQSAWSDPIQYLGGAETFEGMLDAIVKGNVKMFLRSTQEAIVGGITQTVSMLHPIIQALTGQAGQATYLTQPREILYGKKAMVQNPLANGILDYGADVARSWFPFSNWGVAPGRAALRTDVGEYQSEFLKSVGLGNVKGAPAYGIDVLTNLMLHQLKLYSKGQSQVVSQNYNDFTQNAKRLDEARRAGDISPDEYVMQSLDLLNKNVAIAKGITPIESTAQLPAYSRATIVDFRNLWAKKFAQEEGRIQSQVKNAGKIYNAAFQEVSAATQQDDMDALQQAHSVIVSYGERLGNPSLDQEMLNYFAEGYASGSTGWKLNDIHKEIRDGIANWMQNGKTVFEEDPGIREAGWKYWTYLMMKNLAKDPNVDAARVEMKVDKQVIDYMDKITSKQVNPQPEEEQQ